ncbi:hypothetical protein Tco_0592212, partial [Tanacetum coccineum]
MSYDRRSLRRPALATDGKIRSVSILKKRKQQTIGMTQIGSLTGQYQAEGLVAIVHSIVDPGRSHFFARAYGKE